ncbi:hypothetical protein ISS42_02915 [Candidatus Shapirobacteria bacterium]|nr:hypothetical protein [Candidatus Shapirobacteria bacterium]
MENKERLGRARGKEELIHSSEIEFRIPKEIEGWIEKVEKKDLYLSKPATDDQGQVIVTSSQAKPTKITLPLSKSGLVGGLKKEVGEAVRWLAEWCLRLIKINPGGVLFKTKKIES